MSLKTFALRAMLPAVLLTAAAGAVAASPGIKWEKDYTLASRRATSEKRLMLLDFYADWCGPCKLMDEKTFSEASVVEMSKKFVPVRVDIDNQKALAARFKVQAIPFIVVARPDGSLVRTAVGFQSPDALKALMEKAIESEK